MTRSISPDADASVPADIGPNHYDLSVLGPLALGLSLGLQVMMSAFMLLGFSRGEPFADQLTVYATLISFPEYDLLIFVGGLLLTLVSSLATVTWWSHNVRQIPSEQRARFIRLSASLQGALATASLIAFTCLLCSYWFSHHFHGARMPYDNRWGRLDGSRLLVPAIMAAVCAVWDLKFGCGRAAGCAGPLRKRRKLVSKIMLAAFPVLIVLVIAIPPARWTDVAGQFMLNDRFHHMNFFVLGPALSFAHGKAFGTEIYSQYGIGWPLLLSKLSGLSVGSYGAFVGIEVVYACLYYSAWFFLLWLCFRRAIWAAIGVVLAIGWQLFSGVSPEDLIWLTPSSTMMRHPFDVWFFLALVLHQRSGRRAWILLAGSASALGIFFQTETGIYLLVTFGFYWLLQFGNAFRKGRLSGMKAHLFSLGVFYVTAGSVLLPLLFYASRGTLFTPAFFPGWLESLVRYGSWGVGALPVSIVPDAPLVLFIGMTALYMSAISYAVFRSYHGQARKEDVLIASISAYGLALLLLFVGRSHPYNLCHASVPFAIVFTMLLFRGWQALGRWLPYSSFAPVLSGGLVLLLLTNAHFLRYPSLLRSFFTDAPSAGLSLTSNPVDISGLPMEVEVFVNSFKDTAAAIRSFAPDGRDVAIFDIDDTLFYYAANVAPWSRYASLFTMILTKQSLEDLQHELVERPPGYVVMRGYPDPAGFDFVWSPLYQVVKSRYELAQTIGDYEIWRQRVESPAK